MSAPIEPTTLTDEDLAQIDQANASGRTPVVFVHGLWLLPSSWDRWAEAVRDGRLRDADARAGPTTPNTVAGGQRAPRGVRRQDGRRVADHYAEVIGAARQASRRSIGHSFGGLLTQILAGRGLAAAPSAIDPAPFRGVLPLPISALQVGVTGAGQPGATSTGRSR